MRPTLIELASFTATAQDGGVLAGLGATASRQSSSSTSTADLQGETPSPEAQA